MEVYDFLPTYIDFDYNSILGPDLIDETSLYYKKEFNEYKLETIEDKPKSAGKYMNHQILISRFLSTHTPYKGILIMHEPGTGKTCLSISVIEKILSESSLFRGALILMKGKNLINNYKRELVDVCTDHKYEIEDEDEMTDKKKKRRTNKKISEFYKFQTFETFSKRISKLKEEEIVKQYNNLIIVIDEAHHLRLNQPEDTLEQKSQYNNINRFLKTVQNSKTILMTGTPMIDNVSEIASLMNLILDRDQSLPTGNDFLETYMIKEDETYSILPSKKEELKQKLHGKVSFLKSMKSSVNRQYEGVKLDLRYFKQYAMEMGSNQLEYYSNAIKDDDVKGGVYTNSREANLFVYPDGSWGKKGFEKYVTDVNQKFSLKPIFFKEISGDWKKMNTEEKLSSIKKYSVKYAECIRLLLENKEKKHFIYLDIVQGSGAIIFSLLLEQFDILSFRKQGNGIKYALLTSKTSSDINDAIETYNRYDSIIKVIIGTKIISEGFSLKNVELVHILTPHWNFSETDQAIARAFRLFSHEKIQSIKKDLIVKIYLYTCSIKNFPIDQQIDRYMYKICENKDLPIKSMEYLLKQVSFDCLLNKNRNKVDQCLNYSRECEYQKCEYTCYKEEDGKIDDSTFNLFYDEKEVSVIIKRIKKLFKNRPVFHLEEIKELLKEHSEYSLLKSIFHIIHHKIEMYSRNGSYFYLYHINDILYLSPDIHQGKFLDSFYVDHDPLQMNFIMKDRMYLLWIETFKKMVENHKSYLLDMFSPEVKQMMLEYSIISKEKQIKNIDPIREYLLDQFKDFFYKKETTIVSTLHGKKCLDLLKIDEGWKECEEKEEKEEKETVYKKGEYIFTLKDDQLKIKKDIVKKDKRHDNRNILCTNIDKERLIDLIINIDMIKQLHKDDKLYIKEEKENLIKTHLEKFTKKDLCEEIKIFIQK